MVNTMIDSEKIIKHLITQYCDQQFKFTLNLKILGSIHVIVDNNEVLTCLLDEKYFKPNTNRGLIIPNNSYNPSSVLPLQANPADHAMNLVNTLSQLQQQQRCQKMSVSTVTSGKSSSKSSTGSHSSSSSASSSSSYISSVLTDQSNQELMNGNSKHKRKRFTPKTNSVKSGMNDDAASTGSSKKDSTENGSDNEHDNVSDVDETTGNSHEMHANPNSHVSSSLASNMQRMTTNDTHEDAMDDMAQHETDYLDASHMDQTPLKRNKLDTEYEGPIESVTSNSNSNPTTYSNPTSNSSSSVVSDAEAAAAAAATLSLISVASKLQSHNQNIPASNTGTAATASHPTGAIIQPDLSQATANTNGNKINHKKSKIKSIIEEYNKNEQFQLQLQQQEQARASICNPNGQLDAKNEENYDHENQHNLAPSSADTNDIQNASSSSEDQLYMDEGGIENGANNVGDETKTPMDTAHLQRQQQQHQLMMAAAAAIMNNNGAHGGAAGVAGGTFMPQLALNLAMAQQQQTQSVVLPKKKKQRQNSMMSPSSSTSSSSGTTAGSKKSTSTTGSKKNKRQTVAALTTGAKLDSPAKPLQVQHDDHPQSTDNNQPEQPNDLQRNLAAFAQQFGLNKDNANNFDKIIQDMNVNNEKSKLLLTHTPQPTGVKLSKKHHLLAARSANNSPHVTVPKQPRAPKTKKAQFQDSSNLPQANQTAQVNQNPMAQAAAAALRYQQLLNQVNGQTNANVYNSPHKMYGNNYQDHVEHQGYEQDENEETENNYNEPGLDDKPNPGMMGAAGSINFKSLAATKQEPFAMNNSNAANVNPVGANNLEFECTACDKKFKYYCYYKRHMDACHSDNPKYVCDTCNKSYKWEASFRQHLRSHHVAEGGSNGKEDGQLNHLNQGQQNQHHGNDQDNSVYNNLKMSFQNNENMMANSNELEDEDDENYNEYTDDVDGQELDIEGQINRSQNCEGQQAAAGANAACVKMERDTEQMGAAGALASIADTIQNMIQAKSNLVPTSN